jgi:hypothetical protein
MVLLTLIFWDVASTLYIVIAFIVLKFGCNYSPLYYITLNVERWPGREFCGYRPYARFIFRPVTIRRRLLHVDVAI